MIIWLSRAECIPYKAENFYIIRRGFIELPDDKEGQKILVSERKRLFDGLVNALDLKVKNCGEMDNPEPPHKVIKVIIALGSARVFTAMVSVFKAWLESKKIQK